MPVVGFLHTGSPDQDASLAAAFRRGLEEQGYVAGKNVVIEQHWGEGRYDRLPALVDDLVNRRVTVIAATGGSPAAKAAKAATTTIPVVFHVGVDPVEMGLVTSLNRPGGNLTGVTTLALELGPKRLEMLRELVPAATTVGALINPTNSTVAENLSKDLHEAARALWLQLHVLHAGTEQELEAAFATMSRVRIGGLWIGSDPFFNSRAELLATLTIRYALPTIYQYRDFVAAGGLMSYGGSNADSIRQAGILAGRILKGAKPADLPVQQATKVELIVNLKTAKALGIEVPLPLLMRIDEVIE